MSAVQGNATSSVPLSRRGLLRGAGAALAMLAVPALHAQEL